MNYCVINSGVVIAFTVISGGIGLFALLGLLANIKKNNVGNQLKKSSNLMLVSITLVELGKKTFLNKKQ
jgi:hypothetical protein